MTSKKYFDLSTNLFRRFSFYIHGEKICRKDKDFEQRFLAQANSSGTIGGWIRQSHSRDHLLGEVCGEKEGIFELEEWIKDSSNYKPPTILDRVDIPESSRGVFRQRILGSIVIYDGDRSDSGIPELVDNDNITKQEPEEESSKKKRRGRKKKTQ